MNRTSGLYGLFEQPRVFDLYQVVMDGGKTRHIRSFLEGVPYQSVVDVGCGTGNWAELAKGPYLGVDTSPAFIAGCRRRFAGDEQKRFVQADATTLDSPERYDLGLLISVLHHVSDDEARSLLRWVVGATRYFFVLDLYPIPWNPLARLLYKLDRGDYIRSPEEQKRLLLSQPGLHLAREGDYYCWNRTYRHTLFLFECREE